MKGIGDPKTFVWYEQNRPLKRPPLLDSSPTPRPTSIPLPSPQFAARMAVASSASVFMAAVAACTAALAAFTDASWALPAMLAASAASFADAAAASEAFAAESAAPANY